MIDKIPQLAETGTTLAQMLYRFHPESVKMKAQLCEHYKDKGEEIIVPMLFANLVNKVAKNNNCPFTVEAKELKHGIIIGAELKEPPKNEKEKARHQAEMMTCIILTDLMLLDVLAKSWGLEEIVPDGDVSKEGHVKELVEFLTPFAKNQPEDICKVYVQTTIDMINGGLSHASS